MHPFSTVRCTNPPAGAEDEEEVPEVPTLAPELETYTLQPTVYVPTHSRDVSMSASEYSTNSRRRSSVSSIETLTHEASAASKIGLARSDSAASRRHSVGANSLMPPPSPNTASKDRFSEFFDAYYRHSQSMAGPEASYGYEVARTETLAIPRHSTIVEVPSPLATPLASPNPYKKRMSVRVSEVGTAI